MSSILGKRVVPGVAAVVVAGGFLGLVPAAEAAMTVAIDRLAYSGTVTRYATREDAWEGHNALETHTITGNDGNRDLAIYLTDDGQGNREVYIMTAWYYSTNPEKGPYSGHGNPSNTNVGFFQIYDDDASSLTDLSAAFSPDGTTFALSVNGSGAHYDTTQSSSDLARMWAAPLSGAAVITAGVFEHYELSLAMFGMESTTENGWTTSTTEEPTGVTGNFKAIFENKNATYFPDSSNANADLEGFYVANFELHLDSWAWANRDNIGTGLSFVEITAVPEPASLGVLGIGALGLMARRRKAA